MQTELADIRFEPQLGAEARIALVSWHGKPAVSKTRLPKDYRNQELDSRLRTRRTREEARILHEAKRAGVRCPWVYFVDPSRGEIILEFVAGVTLRDLSVSVDESPSRVDSGLLYDSLVDLGRIAYLLHSKNIIHGDLTTKNAIIVAGQGVSLIDFGLSFISERTEDRGEDTHLMKQALQSSLTGRTALIAFDKFLEGYSRFCSRSQFRRLLEQIKDIERRGRYAVVD